jgi:hypothetical protein
MQFYLGAHRAHWLALSPVPLFISHRTLRTRRHLPRAQTRWALDSGGFSELALHGSYRETPAAYAAAVRRYVQEIGQLDFAATQDWMCEPAMLARTGMSVREHQWRSIESYLQLSALAPELPWMPVLQGWAFGEYLDHVEMYRQLGVDLARVPLVGVGSICRRQRTERTSRLSNTLASYGLRLHGFGLKTSGLLHAHRWMHSSDSMAWSFAARKAQTGLQNSLPEALGWRAALLDGQARRERARAERTATSYGLWLYEQRLERA